MKKQLGENERKIDDTLDQEESNSEEEKEDGDILEVYIASPSSSESQPEEDYTTKERLVAEPFSIGGQNDLLSRSTRVIRKNTKRK